MTGSPERDPRYRTQVNYTVTIKLENQEYNGISYYNNNIWIGTPEPAGGCASITHRRVSPLGGRIR